MTKPDFPIGKETRYLRNELKRVRDILNSFNKELISGLVGIGTDLERSFESLRKEIKLCRQTYILIRLSEMTKARRKAFLQMVALIQEETDFIDAFDDESGLINLQKIKNTL